MLFCKKKYEPRESLRTARGMKKFTLTCRATYFPTSGLKERREAKWLEASRLPYVL